MVTVWFHRPFFLWAESREKELNREIDMDHLRMTGMSMHAMSVQQGPLPQTGNRYACV